MGQPEPDWVSDSKLLQDAKAYMRTLRAALNQPRRFAASWAAGDELEAMNPLTFLMLSLGVQGSMFVLVRWFLPSTSSDPSATPALLRQVALFVEILFIGAFQHLVVFRSKRLRLRTSVGAVFYARGSWGMINSVALGLIRRLGLDLTVASAIFLAFDVLVISAFMAGAHQRGIRRTYLLTMLTLTLLLFLCATLYIFAQGE